jgi:hypothetical protein
MGDRRNIGGSGTENGNDTDMYMDSYIYIYNITNYDGSNRLGGWSKFIQQQEPGPKTIRFLS